MALSPAPADARCHECGARLPEEPVQCRQCGDVEGPCEACEVPKQREAEGVCPDGCREFDHEGDM